MEQKEFTK
jgi:RIO kinase 1